MSIRLAASMTWLVASSAATDNLIFSAGFTSDMVLQRAPARAAIYGLVANDDTVAVTITNDADGTSYQAEMAEGISAGVSAGMCAAQCVQSDKVTCRGSSSACLKPSCEMGCRVGRYVSLNECKTACQKQNKQQGGAGWPFNFQDNEGTDCPKAPLVDERGHATGDLMGGCPADDSCEIGCEWSKNTTAQAWKAYLKQMPAGGSFSITAHTGSESKTIRRVTFGDVWLCSGQSNMELSLKYSFSREHMVKAIKAGQYSNVRFFHYGDMGTRYAELEPAFATSTGGPLSVEGLLQPAEGSAYTPGSGGFWWNVSHASTVIRPDSEGGADDDDGVPANPFSDLSSACFYFAAALTDLLGESAPPIGLIESAIGGTKIEEWMDNSTLLDGTCSNESLSEQSGRLYAGMAAPFVNTTVKGWLWYQGENNCGDVMGNSAEGVGYGCEQVQLVKSWRKVWSAEAGTTDPEAPFGVVTIAPDGSEGNGAQLAKLRWSQTGNYGRLPNEAMPNTFSAQAFDLPDPWQHKTATVDNHCNIPPYGESCEWKPEDWPEQFQPLLERLRPDKTPVFMGSIHPRLKEPVGQRLGTAVFNLAYGGTGPVTGPTIAGCAIAPTSDGVSLTLAFDHSMLGDDRLLVRAFDADMDNWSDDDAASLMVCVGDVERCADAEDYYCANCDGVGTGWFAAPVSLASIGAALVVANLSSIVAADKMSDVVAVRYGWPMRDATCCPHKSAAEGRAPCIPGACPIFAESSGLPANPFYAKVKDASCECMAPQECSSSPTGILI